MLWTFYCFFLPFHPAIMIGWELLVVSNIEIRMSILLFLSKEVHILMYSAKHWFEQLLTYLYDWIEAVLHGDNLSA